MNDQSQIDMARVIEARRIAEEQAVEWLRAGLILAPGATNKEAEMRFAEEGYGLG